MAKSTKTTAWLDDCVAANPEEKAFWVVNTTAFLEKDKDKAEAYANQMGLTAELVEVKPTKSDDNV